MFNRTTQNRLKSSYLVKFEKIQPHHSDQLVQYLHNLSEETKQRFGPHPFDKDTVSAFYTNPKNLGYCAIDTEQGRLIAYAIIRHGYLEHDSPRLSAYGLQLNHQTDSSFAPSVADDWQGKGLGKELFAFIMPELISLGINRVILWGGVQSNNERAVRYYQKLGFQTLGHFEYHGMNTDMVCRLPGG